MILIQILSTLFLIGLIIFIYEKVVIPKRVATLSIKKMKSMLENISLTTNRRGIYKWDTSYKDVNIKITAEVEEVDVNGSESKIKVNKIYVMPVTSEHGVINESNAKQMMERWMPSKNVIWIQDNEDRKLQKKLKKVIDDSNK